MTAIDFLLYIWFGVAFINVVKYATQESQSISFICNKIKPKSFKSSEHEEGMGHIAVSATEASSVTLQIWQHVAEENYCKFAFFKQSSRYKD